MSKLSSLYQSGDWKQEKHVPMIAAPETATAGEEIEIKVSIGEDDPHPNTLEHHISWIKVYFQPEGFKFPIELGTFDFEAHGEEEVFTEPNASVKVKVNKAGTIFAASYCNIHGLWENSQELKIG